LLHLVGCLYYLYQCCTVKQISDNEIYLLIKHIRSVICRVAKRLSYIQDARCLKVKQDYKLRTFLCSTQIFPNRSVLTICHKFSRYTFECNNIYEHKKNMAFPTADFHGTRKCLTALSSVFLYRFSPKLQNKLECTDRNSYRLLNKVLISLFDLHEMRGH